MTRKRRRDSSFEVFEPYEEEGERDFDVDETDASEEYDSADDGSDDASLASDSDASRPWEASDESDNEQDAPIEESEDDDDGLEDPPSDSDGEDELPESLTSSPSPLERLPVAIRRHILFYVQRDPLAAMSLALSSRFFYQSIFREKAWATVCRSYGRKLKSPNCRSWRTTFFAMMHRKCIWCGIASVANIGKIIRRAPDWLVCCVPCQSVPGPYQVVSERFALQRRATNAHLRRLPFKLSRVPKRQRKDLKGLLHKGRFEKQFLAADAVSSRAAAATLVADRWRASYRGAYPIDIQLVIGASAVGHASRLLDLARFTFQLKDVQPADLHTLSSYYEMLQETRVFLMTTLFARGSKHEARHLTLLTRPSTLVRNQLNLPGRTSWVELVADPDVGLSNEAASVHMAAARESREAKKARQSSAAKHRKPPMFLPCGLSSCPQARKRDCANELCGLHCPGCPAHLAKAKDGKRPSKRASPGVKNAVSADSAQSADVVVRRAVDMEIDGEPGVKNQPQVKRLNSIHCT